MLPKKIIESNELIVVQGRDHPSLYSKQLTADQLHWISGSAPKIPITIYAKVRYRQQDEKCTINSIKDGVANVSFDQPIFAVTPGQSVVFYNHDVCLGGGIIQ
mgnify:FL=1